MAHRTWDNYSLLQSQERILSQGQSVSLVLNANSIKFYKTRLLARYKKKKLLKPLRILEVIGFSGQRSSSDFRLLPEAKATNVP